MKTKLRSLKLPCLKLYQQIIICFVLVVFLPLLGVSCIIYNINQKALKKELGRFTEHTAEALYKDLQTEMSWQQDQTQMLGSYLLDTYGVSHHFQNAADVIFRLSPAHEAVGIYNEQGQAIETAYRNYAHLTPELRLPAQISQHSLNGKAQYEVIYANTGNPTENAYYLRAIVAVARPPVAYYVIQRRFAYLQELIRSNSSSIHASVYIMDNAGLVIAGPSPETISGKEHISPQDYRFFESIRPGVTEEFSTTAPTTPSDNPEDSEEKGALQKVFVKMPNINWGIIIESPYNVRQTYVKRARDQSFLLIVACLVLVIGMALFYILGISRNFRQLIKVIKAMAEGNYARKIRLITTNTTPYEIVYLAGEFNRMGKKMSDAWHQSQTLNEELMEANNKLAKLDELKSNLIDTVSHELRTPLTSIKGYTSRLLRSYDSLDPETRTKSLRVVKQQADRLGRLVEDLLVIPDLESSTLRVFPDQVCLNDLTERCVQFIQEKEHREIFVTGLLEASSLSVLADPDRLEQVMLNLLDNAVKYSYAGSPIEVLVETSTPEWVQVTVANWCDPIPEEDLHTLFDKFKRLDERLTRTTRGSGLGLFITKGLVEAMGGVIVLKYQEERFLVTLSIPLYQEALLPTY